MLQGHNGAETPSGEQIKLRIGIPLREGWRDGVGKRVGEDVRIRKKGGGGHCP